MAISHAIFWMRSYFIYWSRTRYRSTLSLSPNFTERSNRIIDIFTSTLSKMF
ncbi:hypothetical protein Plhal304r1_c006g0025541 [Plasmopara halstedii]